MVALLDRIKKAEAEKAAASALRMTEDIAAMTEEQIEGELAQLDASRGVSVEEIEQHRRFWSVLRQGDIDAERALAAHRVTLERTYSPKMSDAEMRAWLAEFDAMQCTPVGLSDLTTYA